MPADFDVYYACSFRSSTPGILHCSVHKFDTISQRIIMIMVLLIN